MYKLPRITIVTPSLNQGRFLDRTIQSVLAQDYPNLEYIVVDGGSTDESPDILKRYSNRLTYWVSEPDGGQADAIRKGFCMSTGDVMAWLNSDDLLLPHALATVASCFAQASDIQMIHGDIIVIDEEDQMLGLVKQIPARFETLLYGGHIINQEAVFWKRGLYERVGGLNGRLTYALDYDLWVRMAQRAKPHHVPSILSAFRWHPLQATRQVGVMDCYKREMKETQRRFRTRLGEGRPSFVLKSLFWRTVVSLHKKARGLNRRRPATVHRDHLAGLPDNIVRLIRFYGAFWLYGHHDDGWLRRSAALAVRSEQCSRKLSLRYVTHDLPVEGILKVRVWTATNNHWNVSSESEFQIHREGDGLTIDVPASASPFVVVRFDFERCRVLGLQSAESWSGGDFRRVSIQVTHLDYPTGQSPIRLLR